MKEDDNDDHVNGHHHNRKPKHKSVVTGGQISNDSPPSIWRKALKVTTIASTVIRTPASPAHGGGKKTPAAAAAARSAPKKRNTNNRQIGDLDKHNSSGSSLIAVPPRSVISFCLQRNPGVGAIEEAIRERFNTGASIHNRSPRVPKSSGSGFGVVRYQTQEDSGKVQGSLKVDTPAALLRLNYRYISLLDEGSFGKIYKAINVRTHAVVAIKQIDRNKEAIRNWIDNGCLNHEMRIMLAVKHPNLVGALDAVKFRTCAFIIMPYVDGGNVRSWLRKQCRPLVERQARKWFYDMAMGMYYLHENQIVHRDLKLENLLIDAGRDRLMIADFGFAKLQPLSSKVSSPPPTTNNRDQGGGGRTTETATIPIPCQSACGTVEYSAPEINLIRLAAAETDGAGVPPLSSQQKKYDGKAADVYSMGVCLFEMIYLFKAFIKPMEVTITDQTELLRLVHPRQMAERFTENPYVKPSETCLRLLYGMLKPAPHQRPTVEQILLSEWLSVIVRVEQRKREKLKHILKLVDEYMAIDAE